MSDQDSGRHKKTSGNKDEIILARFFRSKICSWKIAGKQEALRRGFVSFFFFLRSLKRKIDPLHLERKGSSKAHLGGLLF